MASVGLVVHPERPEATKVALHLVEWLQSLGHVTWLPLDDAARMGRTELGRPDGQLCDGLDLAVSLGGDGTMLRTVALVAEADVPVVGVNFGQLGYLTDVEPEGARHAIERFLAGEHHIEERMLLEVRLAQGGDYPWEGNLRIQVDPAEPREFTVAVRVPGWARGTPVRPTRRGTAARGATGTARRTART